MFKSLGEERDGPKKRSSSLSGAQRRTSVKKSAAPNQFANKAYDEFITNAYDDEEESYFQINAPNDQFSAINTGSARSNGSAYLGKVGASFSGLFRSSLLIGSTNWAKHSNIYFEIF